MCKYLIKDNFEDFHEIKTEIIDIIMYKRTNTNKKKIMTIIKE